MRVKVRQCGSAPVRQCTRAVRGEFGHQRREFCAQFVFVSLTADAGGTRDQNVPSRRPVSVAVETAESTLLGSVSGVPRRCWPLAGSRGARCRRWPLGKARQHGIHGMRHDSYTHAARSESCSNAQRVEPLANFPLRRGAET